MRRTSSPRYAHWLSSLGCEAVERVWWTQAVVEHFEGELTDTRFLEVWLGRRAGGMHASRRSMLAQSQPQLEPEPEPGVETETMDNPIASELSL